MITLPIWLAIIALILASVVGGFFGVCLMAWVAMAHYDGDQQRSEPE